MGNVLVLKSFSTGRVPFANIFPTAFRFWSPIFIWVANTKKGEKLDIIIGYIYELSDLQTHRVNLDFFFFFLYFVLFEKLPIKKRTIFHDQNGTPIERICSTL